MAIQLPPTTSSQLCTIAVATSPPRTDPTAISPSCPGQPLAASDATTPTRIPAIISGSTEDGSAAACSFAGATSTTSALLSLAAWVSSWATIELPADEVSTFGPAGVTTHAP